MSPISRRRLAALAAVGGFGILTGCASDDPLGTSSAATGGGSSTSLVVGSQQYYSNEIIAELYAQMLEAAGYQVTRQYQIGQREIYLPELEAGKIDVIPEYGGNLMQYYDKQAAVTDPTEITATLARVLPAGLRALKAAAASDQDSYTVTPAFAQQHGLTSIADLTKAPQPLKLAANSEFASRPYGPAGVQRSYGVVIELLPVEDSGGPLTLRALTDGTVQVADLYTSDPAIAKNNLVILTDPKHLILPQNVTPVVSKKVDDKAAEAIGAVNAKLLVADLQALNAQSVDEQAKSSDIAAAWLKAKGLR